MKLAFIMGVLAFAANAAAEASKCQLRRISEWTVRANYISPVVEGTINGQPVGVLLDTGAEASMIKRSATVRLGLARQPIQGGTLRIYGVGGESGAEAVHVDEFRIGKMAHAKWRAIVVSDTDFGHDIAVLLGADFFRDKDIEFDLANNAVRLYRAKDCGKASLAYWTTQPIAVPLEGDDKIVITVAVNGKPLRAELDSGAGRSVLTKLEAAERGVKPDSPGVVPAGCIRGSGSKSLDSWVGPFESFAIGNQLIRNPQIRFADVWQHMTYPGTRTETQTWTPSRLPQRVSGLPQMLLGADFLRAHRVLVAHSQGRLYFTYERGTVFITAPARGCNAPS